MTQNGRLATTATIALSAWASVASGADLSDIAGVWATADQRCESPNVAWHIMHDRIVIVGNYAEGACVPTSIKKRGRTYAIKARCDQEGYKSDDSFEIVRLSAKALSIGGDRFRYCSKDWKG